MLSLGVQLCDASGLHVISGGLTSIVVRDASTLQQLFALPVPAPVSSMAFSTDELALLVGLDNGELHVFARDLNSRL